MTDSATPLVSVCIITYNHEKYIRQTLDSVLAQVTGFPIEVVIGEDLSTDATGQIVQELQNEHPAVIRVLRSQANLGMNRNLVRTLEQCRGRYIALLEGDDVWTSPHKIQEQVSFLENNPDCTICFHKAEVYIEEKDQVRGVWPEDDPETLTTIEDLIKYNYIPTCTVMYRNVPMEPMPEQYYKLGSGDWSLHMRYAQKGKIGFIDQVMARYRIHASGVFSRLSMLEKFEVVVRTREFVFSLLSKELKKILGPIIVEYCYQIAQMSLAEKDTSKAKRYLSKGISYLPYFRDYAGRYLFLGLYLRVFFPRLASFISNRKHGSTTRKV